MPSSKFKTSPYIRNGLTKSHKAWYGKAYWLNEMFWQLQ